MVQNCVCDFCGSHKALRSLKEEKFVYGAGEDEVVLSVAVPVVECEACGEAYTDAEAEDIRHVAVCNHLGVMTPAEIRMLRENHGLTQEQFAKVSGFGVASIKRWELGNQIQNVSADRYMRLLRMPQNFRLTQSMSKREHPRPRFQTEIPQSAIEDAKRFRLRISELDEAV